MILHVDMDAFYASVEQRDQPQLVGQPVIVGGTPQGRGVVAAANYVARRFGVHSAMPAAQAKRLCPHAVFLRPRMQHYTQVAAEIRAVLERYTPLVEPLSLDEAFLDVTGSESLYGPAERIARQIKQEIRETLSLVASVGVAPNKFLAKIASDLNKPDGLVVVDPEKIPEFLDPLPVGRLWGVGRVTGQLFRELGIQTIGQLRQLPADTLRQHFGNQGMHFWELARGLDDRAVTPEREAKSISHEKTFPSDIQDPVVLRAWLVELAEQVACRLRHHGWQARSVHLKLRYDDFHTVTRTQTLAAPTNVSDEIWKAAQQQLERLPRRTLRVRLLGVGVGNLCRSAPVQLELFADPEHDRHRRLDAVKDTIKQKFGPASLQRGSGIMHQIKPKPAADGTNPDQYGE